MVLSCVALTACGDRGDEHVAWHVRFTSPALDARAVAIEVELREGRCEASGATIATIELTADVPRGTGEPYRLARGQYALAARARDASCTWFASGCTTVDVPVETSSVVVELDADATPAPACPADLCNAGSCREDAIVEIAAGRAHACARSFDGRVWCWGRNEEGQIGDGALSEPRTAATPVIGIGGATQIDAGGNLVGWQSHTCAVIAPDATAECWGFNESGQLGDGMTATRPIPAPVVELRAVRSIATGALHTCASTSDGVVLCWGDNAQGQLGDGTTTSRPAPRAVSGVSGVVEVTAGQGHSCARLQTSRVECWGANAEGQLGDGTTTERPAPVDVGRNDVADVDAGVEHTCIATTSGAAVCWGSNDSGQLGTGTTDPTPGHVEIAGVAEVVEVAAANNFSCARTRDGEVWCWGSRGFGYLGDGLTTPAVSGPVRVALADAAVQVAASVDHACALTSSREVWCWGRNQYGRLGDGTFEDRSAPVRVTGLP